MAAADATREEAFESEIAEYLAAHGWEYSPTDDGYDAERALWPEDVHWWLSTTQPESMRRWSGWAPVPRPPIGRRC